MTDTNFDTRASKFARNIYNSSKGRIREAVVMRELTEHLLPHFPAGAPILDAGGGQGQVALQLAALGHPVTLCDLSSEMLELARDNAEAQGLTQRLTLVNAPIQSLSRHLAAPVPIILCHAVMEWLAQPRETLMELVGHLAPGGYLSLMFFNYRGMEMHNLVSGNFDNLGHAMVHGKKKVKLAPRHGFDNQQVIDWLERAGLEPVRQVGVRVIHDYLRDKSMQQSQYQRLLELELEYASKPVFRDLGRYTHLIMKRPG
ncbi:methyltransferase domain-containing protein [Ferrimonas sediminicola]|uniref:tRNA 5-carboxymethoxyuridine methyltransferase n=1 Tax=Ferrimonas sediminicola TaxID=2569538 RepID=A0A4U1BC01_9GAMM|nr:methyltransferase domain-containing protein [Ferrimonas sediminicola]TKB48472.1 methyltransferase domain-containing protein [Ferrimonas sediminicola]